MLLTEKTLAVLNRMVADGLVAHYAIGGAIAAAFYIEPTHLTSKWHTFQRRFLNEVE